MDAELQKLIRIESYLLDKVAFDILGIPKDEFYKFGSSALRMEMEGQDKKNPNHEALVKAKNEFDLLCRSAPNTSRDAIKSICLASTSYDLCFGASRVEEITSIRAMSVLLMITMARGFAMGAASSSPAASEVMRKMMLSVAGLNGAHAKHSKAHALKAWAEREAAGKSDLGTARRLAGRAPAHLVNESESNDPVRLIYNHLRNVAKRNTDS